MFDIETTRLIQSAVALEGLNLERLPQDLTEAYALVIAARLGALGASSGRTPADWQNSILQLRRLAETYEGLTIFLPHGEAHRPACAFVSGSAHFTLNQVRRAQMQFSGDQVAPPSLSANAVGPEVAATLLFLAGGHQADAAETAKTFTSTGTTPVLDQLLAFISALASGEGYALQAVIGAQLELAPRVGVDYLDSAAEVMWRELARAVQLVARSASGLPGNNALVLLDEVVERMSRARAPVDFSDSGAWFHLPLAGPYHLAKLLRVAAEVLLSSAVSRTQPPGGVGKVPWSRFTRHFARRRPFLWGNHREAIGQGFLEAGSSFVMTFPTGAGKTAITELRIAAELMRGRKVIYLAPTRALVDQVAKEVSGTVRPIAPDVVRGRFQEDFGEKVGAMVFVQTPEQCLAYLSHQTEGHRDIGLIVVDECHQLSGTPPSTDGVARLPNRRAVDAMWALLSLLQRSPGADIVLISAMVRNGGELARWLEASTGRPAKVLDLAWKPTRQIRGVIAYESSEVGELQAELRRRRASRGGNGRPRTQDKNGLVATPVGLFCHTQIWSTTSTFSKFSLLPMPVPLGVNDNWRLTANRNEVGGILLGALAHAKMRPMVFTQRVDWTTLIAEIGARYLEASGWPPIRMREDEEALLGAAALELGGSHLVESPALQRVGIHHGLLLPPERLAMESAFRRPDGLLALVATPTVAQGINLPAEAVIIAGDDRWVADAEAGGPETLAVHELLNAAGRAGRAGHNAHGVVIDLPGNVYSVRQDKTEIRFEGLNHVMSLFGSPDQCLDIVDPLTQLIDRIASAGAESDVGQYLVRRAGGLQEDALRAVLGAALGNALQAEATQRVETQTVLLKSLAVALDNVSTEEEPTVGEWRELASQAGVSPLTVTAVAASIPDSVVLNGFSFSALLDSHIRLLLDYPGMLFGLVDPGVSSLAGVLPRRCRKQGQKTVYTEDVSNWEQRCQAALREVLPEWISGVPISPLGEILHRHRHAGGRVKAIQLGRRFALQTAGGIGHGVSLIVRVIEKSYSELASDVLPLWLRLLPGCVREGFDDPDKLLLFWYLRQYAGLYPRVRVHQVFDDMLRGQLPAWEVLTDIDGRRSAIRDLIGETAP